VEQRKVAITYRAVKKHSSAHPGGNLANRASGGTPLFGGERRPPVQKVSAAFPDLVATASPHLLLSLNPPAPLTHPLPPPLLFLPRPRVVVSSLFDHRRHFLGFVECVPSDCFFFVPRAGESGTVFIRVFPQLFAIRTTLLSSLSYMLFGLPSIPGNQRQNLFL